MSVPQDPDSVLVHKVNFTYTRKVSGGAASVNMHSARRNGALVCLHNGGDDLIKMSGYKLLLNVSAVAGSVRYDVKYRRRKTQYDSLAFRRLAGEDQWVVEFPLPAKV